MLTRSNPLRGLLAAGLIMAASDIANAGTLVTFQVDMNAEGTAVAGGSTVYLRGNFNGQNFNLLPAHALTNNGANIFSGTIDITNAPGTLIPCKFYYNNPGDAWEGGADRQFILAAGSQTLPLNNWNDKYPSPANNVTFRISMSGQIALGTFSNNPPTTYVRVSGGFNGWSESIDFTNNPALSGTNVDTYSATIPVSGFPGGTSGAYKFRAPIGDTWETISDRPSFTLVGGDQTLPIVYWNNLAPSTPTNNVTFRVDMTTQIIGGNFVPGVGTIRVSGAMTGWGDGADLTNNPALSGNASNIYSTIIPVIGANGDSFEYKFRANGGWESPTSTAGNNRSFQIAGPNQVLPLVFYSDASPCDILSQFKSAIDLQIRSIENGAIGADCAVCDLAEVGHGCKLRKNITRRGVAVKY